jgi:peptide/nickel transport system substrate-binding protein
MQNRSTRFRPLTRRRVLGGSAAIGAAALAGPLGSRMACAQSVDRTLVIAAPATPQRLDMEYDISLGSVDAVGALYDTLLAYEKVPDPDAPGVMREDIGVHPDKPGELALRGLLAERWELSGDSRKATFILRQGVKSNWGNPLTADDVKWTWDRKFHLKGTGLFITKMLGMTSPRSRGRTWCRLRSTNRARCC